MTMLDFGAIAVETPTWASECIYCVPDDFGGYDEAQHRAEHLPLTCDVCGQTSPNRLLFDMSHGINLGASWESGKLLCTSLSLMLNHLTYDLLHGDLPSEHDGHALALGWLIGPDGAQIPPSDWEQAPPSDPYPGRSTRVRTSHGSGEADRG